MGGPSPAFGLGCCSRSIALSKLLNLELADGQSTPGHALVQVLAGDDHAVVWLLCSHGFERDLIHGAVDLGLAGDWLATEDCSDVTQLTHSHHLLRLHRDRCAPSPSRRCEPSRRPTPSAGRPRRSRTFAGFDMGGPSAVGCCGCRNVSAFDLTDLRVYLGPRSDCFLRTGAAAVRVRPHLQARPRRPLLRQHGESAVRIADNVVVVPEGRAIVVLGTVPWRSPTTSSPPAAPASPGRSDRSSIEPHEVVARSHRRCSMTFAESGRL